MTNSRRSCCLLLAALAVLLGGVSRAQDAQPWVTEIEPRQFAAVIVEDLERSVDWYERALGLTVFDRWTSPDGIATGANMVRDELFVELIHLPEAPDVERSRGFYKVGFWVPDLEAVAAQVEAATGERPRVVAFPDHGLRLIQIKDPEGNTIQLSEAMREEAVAFEHVTVVPMDAERVLADHTVLVRGDRIVAVGPSAEVEIPAGATRVDGRGRWLAPGLAEMHGHVPPPSAPAALTEETLFLYLSQGITTVRGMLGAPGQLDLKARANSGEILSPTLYLAGPSFNGNSVSSPEQAIAMVREQVEEGWDLLKVHPGMTRAEFDAMAETANDLGIRFGGHVPADVGIRHAIAMGQETFDHVDGYAEALDGDAGPLDPDALADLVRQSREAGAWIVPTMALWETIYGTTSLDVLRAYPELDYVSDQQIEGWTAYVERALAEPSYDPEAAQTLIANRGHILRALHAGGVRILMGTDAPQLFSVPGFSLHREFPHMTDAGMSPYEILHSGTVLVGEYFANEDTFGLVAPGHRADLILLNADPLADAAHLQEIAGVMVRGRWVPRDELDARLDAIRGQYASGPDAAPLTPRLLAVSVADLDASVDWYREMLRFSEVRRYPFPEDRMRLAFVERDGFELELIEIEDTAPFDAPDAGNPATRRGLVKVAFHTEAIEALYDAAVEKGARVQSPLQASNRTGGRFFILLDPDGNWVQIYGPAN